MKWDKQNLTIAALLVLVALLVMAIMALITYRVATIQNNHFQAQIASLKAGQDRISGQLSKLPTPHDGVDGYTPRKGVDYRDGKDGKNGKDSKSTHTTVVTQRPVNGSKGLSAYDIAVKHGFVGTELQWLASLKGESGIGVKVQLNPTTGDLETKRDDDDFWTVLAPCSRILIGCTTGAL